MLSPRLSRRLQIHHLPIAIAVFASGAALYVTRTYTDPISRLSFATAYPALVLMAWTLMIGPWRVLTKQTPLFSSDFRRDIGIWAGLTGVVHAVAGQFVHLRGRPWLYYVYEDWSDKVMPVRYDLFGFSNYTGLFAALVLAALLATSNDWALRKLGTPGWKSLQRWNYACFALTVLHTFGYMWNGRPVGFFVLVIASVMIAVVLQLVGWRRRKDAAA